ncbi:MAG: flagellar filament capping protein FliD [Desulfotomaculales bacterium]
MAVQRVGGLASGLETQSLVNTLMEAARQPIYRLEQQKQLLEWKRQELREINLSLYNLRNGPALTLSLESTFSARLASSSNEAVLSATATAGAALASYTVTVESVATAAYNVSIGNISATAVHQVSASAYLWNERTKFLNKDLGWDPTSTSESIASNGGTTYNLARGRIVDVSSVTVDGTSYRIYYTRADFDRDTSPNKVLVNTDSGQLTFGQAVGSGSTISVSYRYSAPAEATDSISGTGATTYGLSRGDVVDVTSVTVDGTPYTVYYFQDEFDADPGTTKVLVDADAGTLTFATGITGNIVAAYQYSTTKQFAFRITTYNQDGTANSRAYVYDATKTTLNKVLSDLSAATGPGLTAFFAADRVSLTRLATGDNNPGGSEIDPGNWGFLAGALRIDRAAEQGGTDARVTVNGITLTGHTNEITVNGVTFRPVAAGGPVTVTVRPDVNAIFNAIKTFVDEYNKVLNRLNDELAEPRYPEYPPLTETQKKAMNEDEIKAWEEKAKSGLLRYEFTVRSAVDRLRQAVTANVPGAGYQNLAAVGITTGAYTEKGQLHLNEVALRQAIEANPDGVKELFTKTAATSADQGVGKRVYAALGQIDDALTALAGSPTIDLPLDGSLARQIAGIEEQIVAKEERLALLEARYWREFTALEEFIGSMNALSAWMTQQVSSWAGSRQQ